MEQKTFNKSAIYNLAESIGYATGGIVSKLIAQNGSGNITLFSFDKGQELTPHTTPFDAVVQILDGEAKIQIDGIDHAMKTGEMIIMPANTSHSVDATQKFKMILTMFKA